MRKFSLLLLSFMVVTLSFAQIKDPVDWTYSAKKINATTYELRLTAKIESGWHLYSQTQPDDAIAQPTTISFNKNPLVEFQGKVKEVGKLEQKHEPLFGVDVKQFSNKVDFVQVIKLKAPVKTNISGSVEFMVCDDTQCLPPSTQKFSLALK